MEFLNSIWAFIVAISILVAFHEFGHYWTAKKLGVKVLRFSVGFGPVIWKKVAGTDNTEYAVSALPLGGYVKMLDEREGKVAASDQHRAFNRQPVWKRFAIVAAGPIFNFVLAIALYTAMYMLGVAGIKPVVGKVSADTIVARAGLQQGSEIISVAGETVNNWQDTANAILNEGINGGSISLKSRDASGYERDHNLMVEKGALLGDEGMFSVLGLTQWRPELDPVIGEILSGGAAEAAGLKTGDRIIDVNGTKMDSWSNWVTIIQDNPDKEMQVSYEREGKVLTIALSPKADKVNGKLIGKIGAGVFVSDDYKAKIDQLGVKVQYNPLTAFGKAMTRTWTDSKLTLTVIWKLITGEASLKNISGPLTIAQYAGITAGLGLATFIGFLAIVSISLGVLNLLPIPILDGGHLLLYSIEWIKGSPVSEAAEAIGQRVGIVLLGTLMLFAIFMDVSRLING